MRLVPQQFADRHDRCGRAREGRPRGRAHRAHAAAEGSQPTSRKTASARWRMPAFPAASTPSATSCSEWPRRIIRAMPITDAWARYVKNNQSPDGRWKCQTLRPPLESSDFEVTAASIRSRAHVRPKEPEGRVRRSRRARGPLARTGQAGEARKIMRSRFRVDLGRRQPGGDPEDRSRAVGAAAV